MKKHVEDIKAVLRFIWGAYVQQFLDKFRRNR